MKMVQVRLRISGIGVITQMYDFDNPSSRECLAWNSSHGYKIVSICSLSDLKRTYPKFTIQDRPMERDYG